MMSKESSTVETEGTKNIVSRVVQEIWVKREYFCFDFSKIKEVEDLAKIMTIAYEVIVNDDEFKFGLIIFTAISAKIDDIYEMFKVLIGQSVEILENTSQKEILTYKQTAGDYNKFNNSFIYMVQSLALNSQLKDSEELYREFVKELIIWLRGAEKMHEFLLKKEEKTFKDYGPIRNDDFGSKCLLWIVAKLHFKFDIEKEISKEHFDMLSQHLWLSNDYYSLFKSDSKDLVLFQNMTEFQGYEPKKIKEFLWRKIQIIENQLEEFLIRAPNKNLKNLQKFVLDCNKAQAVGERYNFLGGDLGH